MRLDDALAAQDYCYLTTTGRVSGKPHTVEIWFALAGATLYILAGARERADFIRNARKQPRVRVRIDEREFDGHARIVGPAAGEDALARRLLLAKYAPPRYEGDLGDWGRTALPLAVDLQ